jgi:hypothetical protein
MITRSASNSNEPVVAGVPPAPSIPQPTHRKHSGLQLRKPHVFARIHLEIEHQRIFRVRLNDFLYEFHVDGVISEHGELIHRLKIDGDEEWPVVVRVDSLAAFDAQDLGNFQELHPRVHHHRLYPGGRDLRLQSVENDMVNHEGKANRRFRRGVQVRIRASENMASAHKSGVIAARENDANLRHGQRLCRRVDWFGRCAI